MESKGYIAFAIATIAVCLSILLGTGVIDISAIYGSDGGDNNGGGTGDNTNQGNNPIDLDDQNSGSGGFSSSTTDAVPAESVKIGLKNKYTQAAITSGRVEVWQEGEDVSDPNRQYLDMIQPHTTTGIAELTGLQINYPSTDSDYDIYFSDNSSGTYYDSEMVNWVLNYNEQTGKGTMEVNGLNYFPVVPVGAFVDVDSLPEVSSSTVWNESPTDNYTADGIAYDESVGSGSAWFYMDIGNANANSELHNVVLCFKDSDGDMDGNEVTGLTVSKVSGSSAISIPGDVLGYWQDGMGSGAKSCIQIANLVGSGETNRYKFLFTFTEANFDTDEEFEICQDDLGDYSAKQYPARHVKATAECLSVADQA